MPDNGPPHGARADQPSPSPVLTDRALALRFESLGGSGHGDEFGQFQRSLGADRPGLLRDADLGHDLLISALETQLEGVGAPEHTIIFKPDHSDEWWTKDRRYWMAMRSFVKITEVDAVRAPALLCKRLQELRDDLIANLKAGDRIFVFKNTMRNLTDPELVRLHAAVRAFGPSTLFYVRYADAMHPPGLVEVAGPGLIVGYIAHFAFSMANQPLGSAEPSWLELCGKAYRLHHDLPLPEPEPQAPPIEPAPEPVPMRRSTSAGGKRKIVLVGNCQVNAMASLYKRFVTPRTGDTIEAVASYQDLTDDGLRLIEEADLLVEQILDMAPRANVPSSAAHRLFIPAVSAAFLWPFAGQQHPRNVAPAFLPVGPYGGEAGDSYLNRLIAAGADPDEAAETYLNLDVTSRINLDRLYELVMDRQRSRDSHSGYAIADVIEENFRTEQIFLTPFHPNLRVAVTLATQFFEQVGASRDDIERMQNQTHATPFPKDELPIHPSVCQHFGLDFIAPDQRYRFMNEGSFTFHEYVLRYMRYEWNEALEEGLSLYRAGNHEAARIRLEEALARSPNSAAGHNALSHIMSDQGQKQQALAAARRALEIEPHVGAYLSHLGNLLKDSGEMEEAETALRAALRAEPADPHFHIGLALLIRQRGKHDEACALIAQAVELDPYSAQMRGLLAEFLDAAGKTDEAASALQAAAAFDPDNAGYQQRLAVTLGRLHRFDDAIKAARNAVAQAPGVIRNRIVLSDLLAKAGHNQDAMNEAYLAVVNEPTSAEAYGHMGALMRQNGERMAAEQAFRRAISLAPDNAHYRHELSVIFVQQDRMSEAVKAAIEAVEREPKNPFGLKHLASLQGAVNDYPAAEASLRRALAIDPDNADIRQHLESVRLKTASAMP